MQCVIGEQAEAVDVVAVIIDKHVENVTMDSSAQANNLVMVNNGFPHFTAALLPQPPDRRCYPGHRLPTRMFMS